MQINLNFSLDKKVETTIGEGAYATVKKAYSEKYGTTVAIKIITKHDGACDKYLRR